MRYQVEPTVVLGEGADVMGAAGALGETTVPEQFGPLRGAVPGGATAAAVSGIASSWRIEITDVRSRVRSLGEALSAAGAGYAQVETVTQLALGSTR
ncbi:MAG: hypothetical protein ABI692_17385 [Terracoccus sp.]